MAEEDLDPVSISALALLQELVNQMPALEGTELWSKESTSVHARRGLDNGRFEVGNRRSPGRHRRSLAPSHAPSVEPRVIDPE